MGSYQNKSERAKDQKSSAIMLLLFGGAGMIFVLLWAFNILPINVSMYNRFLSCGILGAFFLTILIFGFFSIASYNRLKDSAKEEGKLADEICEWYRKELTADKIDSGLFPTSIDEVPEEERYFRRSAKIRMAIAHKFMNLKPDYIEELTDKIYDELYGDN
ncbi:MAG: hypothetical protein V3G41_00100 [Lachnospiraceae bacterium]